MIALDIDARSLAKLAPAFGELSSFQQSEVLPRAINSVGDRVRTALKRTLADESGMPAGRVDKVFSVQIATGGRPLWRLRVRDQWTSLKDFKPRQTKRGVSAAPWHKRRVFPGTFIGPGGHVFKRVGEPVLMLSGRYAGQRRQRIKKLYGPNLPLQVIRGRAGDVFHQVARERLPQYLAYQSDRVLGKVKAKYRLK